MERLAAQLDELLREGTSLIMNLSDDELALRPAPAKWSKKEILGHLIDSALRNLVRFTDARCAEPPFEVKSYEQDRLVLLNDYQNQETEDLLVLWLGLNRRIASVFAAADERATRIPVILPQGEAKDLGFLMADYCRHLQHHLKQISTHGK